jgi:hypothetical protein
MPWWSWVLIWVLLVVALLGMLALFGRMLFRKAMTAFDALGELSSRLELLDAASEAVAPEHFTNAILRDRAEVRQAHRVLAQLRADRKRLRRERRLVRGKLLVTADLRKRTFPWESSATHSDGRT